MNTKTDRQTVDLSEYPDLVVMYLGMRVRAFTFENNMIYSLFPLHLGMRWYWRDFDSMERWTRSEPHRRRWADFLRDSTGTSFSARRRTGMTGNAPAQPDGVTEDEMY